MFSIHHNALSSFRHNNGSTWNADKLALRLHSLCILQGGAEDFRGGSQIFRAKKGGI